MQLQLNVGGWACERIKIWASWYLVDLSPPLKLTAVTQEALRRLNKRRLSFYRQISTAYRETDNCKSYFNFIDDLGYFNPIKAWKWNGSSAVAGRQPPPYPLYMPQTAPSNQTNIVVATEYHLGHSARTTTEHKVIRKVMGSCPQNPTWGMNIASCTRHHQPPEPPWNPGINPYNAPDYKNLNIRWCLSLQKLSTVLTSMFVPETG